MTEPKGGPGPAPGDSTVGRRGDFGGFLRRAREARGVSLAQVAQETRVGIRWLELVELGRLDQLPAEVFVRGFVRSYARAVGADMDQAGRLLSESLNNRAGGDEDGLDYRSPRAEANRRRIAIVLAILLLAIGATVGVSLLMRRRAALAETISSVVTTVPALVSRV